MEKFELNKIDDKYKECHYCGATNIPLTDPKLITEIEKPVVRVCEKCWKKETDIKFEPTYEFRVHIVGNMPVGYEFRVEASNEQEAFEKAMEDYKNDDYRLDVEGFQEEAKMEHAEHFEDDNVTIEKLN